MEGSKKGACSANIQPAKANCLEHNRRNGQNDKHVPSYVNPHLSHLNHTIFEDDMIKGRKSIVPLRERAKLRYTDKTGQKCQASFVPFREDVLSFPGRGDITDEQIIDYLKEVEQKFKVKPIGAWYHKDEGHARSRYIEGDEGFAPNYHVHVLYYCQDPETGKAIRLPRTFFTSRQDFLAKATGLERGTPAAETGRKRRSADQQRKFSVEQRIEQLQTVIDDKEAERDQLKKEVDYLKVGKAMKEKALGVFGQSSKDKTIKDQKRQIQALQTDLKAEKEQHAKDVQVAQDMARKAEKQATIKQETINRLLSIPFLKAVIDIVQRAVNDLSHEFTKDEKSTIGRAIEGGSYDEEQRNSLNLWVGIVGFVRGYSHMIAQTKANFMRIAEERWQRNQEQGKGWRR